MEKVAKRNVKKSLEHGSTFILIVNNYDNHLKIWVDQETNPKPIFDKQHQGDDTVDDRTDITAYITDGTHDSLYVEGYNYKNDWPVGQNPWHFKFQVNWVGPEGEPFGEMCITNQSGHDEQIHPDEKLVYSATLKLFP